MQDDVLSRSSWLAQCAFWSSPRTIDVACYVERELIVCNMSMRDVRIKNHKITLEKIAQRGKVVDLHAECDESTVSIPDIILVSSC